MRGDVPIGGRPPGGRVRHARLVGPLGGQLGLQFRSRGKRMGHTHLQGLWAPCFFATQVDLLNLQSVLRRMDRRIDGLISGFLRSACQGSVKVYVLFRRVGSPGEPFCDRPSHGFRVNRNTAAARCGVLKRCSPFLVLTGSLATIFPVFGSSHCAE